MKKVQRVYLEQTQGLKFDTVADRFEELLDLTDEEEEALIKEVEEEDSTGAVHEKLYKLHSEASRQISEEECWDRDYTYVEDGLCVSVLIEELE